jgi:dihydrolipoamide dehydrogenase
VPAPSLLIIGAGPGGEAAAKHAARAGASVTLVEKREPGGLCLNRGCIPSKALLEGGRLLHLLRAAPYMEGVAGVRVKWDLLQVRKRALVDSLRDSLSQNLARLKVSVLEGEARLLDGRTAAVRGPKGEQRITFDKCVLATGSEPVFPEPFPALSGEVLDSDRALELASVPESLVVVGGGAVGCEFACLFHELGSRVTLVEKTPGLLPGEDEAVVRVLRTSFEARGIRVLTGVTVASAARSAAGWDCRLSDGQDLSARELLVCVGRRPRLEGLGLEAAGVRVERGRVVVDAHLQTSVPGVYAVGDMNGLSLLAHAASAQGESAAGHALGAGRPYAHERVPRCLYTWPEVASVGEWAHTAEAKGLVVKTRRFFFQGSAKARASGEAEGFIQVVSEKGGERLLGAQIVGPHATELIHLFSVALEGGLTVDRLRDVVFAHPTLSEGVREALSR